MPIVSLLLRAGCSPSAFPPAVVPAQPTAEDWPDAGARRLRLRTPLIRVEDWEDFKRFVDEVATEDSRGVQVWLRQ